MLTNNLPIKHNVHTRYCKPPLRSEKTEYKLYILTQPLSLSLSLSYQAVSYYMALRAEKQPISGITDKILPQKNDTNEVDE